MDRNTPEVWLRSSQGQEWIRGYIDSIPSLTRSGLSRAVCDHIGWQDASGRSKEMACRKALCTLERQQVLELPVVQRAVPQRSKPYAVPLVAQFSGSLRELGPVELQRVQGGDASSEVWNGMMEAYHPQGKGPLCGAQIRYLIVSETRGVLGGIAVSAPARRLSARDTWLGWNDTHRAEHLSGIVCNSRFLIVPTVKVENLGSRLLAMLTRRIGNDWQGLYGITPWLMETYVDESRPGTVYRAANWMEVGLTAGRGRQDTAGRGGLSKKRVFLYPLGERELTRLCGQRKRPQISWIQRELGGVDLGDKRLESRLFELAASFYGNPTASIPAACGTWSKTKAAYRFFAHERVTMDKLLEPHLEATIERSRTEPVVLAVEDTTSLNYTTHFAMKGLGPIHNLANGAQGLMLHTAQAFRPDGMPLGLLHVNAWDRDADKYAQERDQNLPIEEKESYKWIQPLDAIGQAAVRCPQTKFVVVADREADIYEFLTEAKARDLPFLVRAKTNRSVLEVESEPRQAEPQDANPQDVNPQDVNPQDAKAKTSKLLWDVIGARQEAGKIELHVPRTEDAPARKALMSVRYAQITLKPPRRVSHLPPLTLWAVLTREIVSSNETVPDKTITSESANPSDSAVEASTKQALTKDLVAAEARPAGTPDPQTAAKPAKKSGKKQENKPLEWMLLTSFPVESVEQASERVQWYTRRWGIEVFHRTLKSGCKIEDRQFGTATRLEACLAIDMVVAWRIHYLTHLGRATPNVPCTVAFSDDEWKAVVAVRTQAIPDKPPTLRELIRHIAILGGFLARKGDGEPGTQTLWRGLQRTQDFVIAFRAFESLKDQPLTTAPNPKAKPARPATPKKRPH